MKPLFYNEIIKRERTDAKSEEVIDHLTSDQLREYCMKRFEFERLEIPYFARLADKRKHLDDRRKADHEKTSDSDEVPADGSHIIFTKKLKMNNSETASLKTAIIRKQPKLKPPLVCLYEYCSQKLKMKLMYEPADPPECPNDRFTLKILVNLNLKKRLGYGHGQSKKSARIECAKSALNELGIKFLENEDEISELAAFVSNEEKCDWLQPSLKRIGPLRITDPNIHALCLEMKCPTPFAILKKEVDQDYFSGKIVESCCENHYSGVTSLKKYDKFAESAKGADKAEAESQSAQKLLAKMYPDFETFGEFLKQYAKGLERPPAVHPEIADIEFNQNDISTKAIEFIQRQLSELPDLKNYEEQEKLFKLK
ncbi:hypothetical protein ACOME3_000675 [Neoechinorhynchus agilis]